jgi:hypothetical protein
VGSDRSGFCLGGESRAKDSARQDFQASLTQEEESFSPLREPYLVNLNLYAVSMVVGWFLSIKKAGGEC